MLELRIAKPCDQTWTAMRGDERSRHCQRCDKNVYNIAQMTEAEVEELIRRTKGHFCARLYRRTDGRVMTRDCPRGVAATRRKRTLALAAAGATMVFGFPLVRPATSGAVARPRAKLDKPVAWTDEKAVPLEPPLMGDVAVTTGVVAMPVQPEPPRKIVKVVPPKPMVMGGVAVDMPASRIKWSEEEFETGEPVVSKRKQ